LLRRNINFCQLSKKSDFAVGTAAGSTNLPSTQAVAKKLAVFVEN
jgi:hypothetical protein